MPILSPPILADPSRAALTSWRVAICLHRSVHFCTAATGLYHGMLSLHKPPTMVVGGVPPPAMALGMPQPHSCTTPSAGGGKPSPLNATVNGSLSNPLADPHISQLGGASNNNAGKDPMSSRKRQHAPHLQGNQAQPPPSPSSAPTPAKRSRLPNSEHSGLSQRGFTNGKACSELKSTCDPHRRTAFTDDGDDEDDDVNDFVASVTKDATPIAKCQPKAIGQACQGNERTASAGDGKHSPATAIHAIAPTPQIRPATPSMSFSTLPVLVSAEIPHIVTTTIREGDGKDGGQFELLTFYNGTLSTHEKTKRVLVNFAQLDNKASATFPFARHGGRRKAFDAAHQHRNEYAAKFGLVQTVRLRLRTVDVRSYFAGFFDGDGCISVSPGTGFCLDTHQSAPYGQTTAPRVLEELQRYYGGTIYACHQTEEEKKTKKPMWMWTVPGQLARRAVQDVAAYGIIKRPQAQLVLEHFAHVPKDNAQLKFNRRTVNDLKDQITEMKSLEQYGKVPIDPARLTVPYIAGLADAEGCLSLGSTTSTRTQEMLEIAQFSCPPLLEAIKAKYSEQAYIRRAYDAHWTVQWRGTGANRMLTVLRPHLIVKRDQADHVLQYMAERNAHFAQGGTLTDGRKQLDTGAKLALTHLKGHRRATSVTAADIGVTSFD
jgi:hypothetical protein